MIYLIIIGILVVLLGSYLFLHNFGEKVYIFNKHTKEIHSPFCHCVENMSRKNKRFISKKRRDRILLKNPRSRCGICKSEI